MRRPSPQGGSATQTLIRGLVVLGLGCAVAIGALIAAENGGLREPSAPSATNVPVPETPAPISELAEMVAPEPLSASAEPVAPEPVAPGSVAPGAPEEALKPDSSAAVATDSPRPAAAQAAPAAATVTFPPRQTSKKTSKKTSKTTAARTDRKTKPKPQGEPAAATKPPQRDEPTEIIDIRPSKTERPPQRRPRDETPAPEGAQWM